jgi:hypothetical protein
MRSRRLTCMVLVSLAALGAGLGLADAPAFAAPLEAPVNKAATAITGITATLNGELNPGASATAGYYFTYSTNPENCAEGPATELQPEATGKGIHAFTTLTELVPSVTYFYCVVATHEGEVVSAPTAETFTTEGVAPVAEGLVATSLTPFSETLEGQVNPENQATECKFVYGTTSPPTELETPCEQGSQVFGYGNQAVTLNATGLASSTKYFYRLVTTNATGHVEPEGEFTTAVAEKPAISGETVTSLTSTEATVEAQVNPNYQTTDCNVLYWPTNSAENLGVLAPCTPTGAVLGVGGVAVAVTAQLGHLVPGVSYDYRVLATNNTGETVGPQESLQALDVPVLTTGAAQEISGTSATLTGTLNPFGAPTTYYFSYIDEAGYQAALAEGAADPYAKGGGTPEVTTQTVGYAAQPANPLTTGPLLPGTTYHYALVASNSVGTVTGPDETFTTPGAPPPPSVFTGPAQFITTGTALLTGSVETQGLTTTTSFEFGSNQYRGSFEGATTLPGAGAATGVTFGFNGYLSPGVTYWYRVVATNANGTSYGAEQSFTTAASPSAAITPITQVLSDVIAGELKPPKKLTNAQKLSAALKACKKQAKSKRAACERKARKRYAPAPKKKKKG